MKNMKLLLLMSSAMIISFALSAQTPQFFKDLQTKKAKSSPFVEWTNFGPGMSGYCDEFFVHPTDPNSMYMSLDMGNSYYTHDNGLTWITTKDWDHDGEGGRPTWMDFSHQDPDFGLAIDEKGNLLQTTDRGATFKLIKSFGRKHSVITVDPSNDNNWYVGAGQYWRVKGIHRSQNNLHGTQYRNTYYGYIWVSKDKGKTWKKVTDKFSPKLDVAKIIVDPTNSNIVYTFTNFGFYKSTNGGYTWNKTGKGLPYNEPRDGDFYYDKKTRKFILYLVEQTHYKKDGRGSVITSGGVYRSFDKGENWKSMTGNLAINMNAITSWPAKNAYYKAIAHWFGISQSNASKTYRVLPSSTFSVFNRVVVSKKNPDVVFLSHNIKHDYAFGPGDIWKTTDGGKNWVVCGRNGSYWKNKKDKAYWQGRRNPLGKNMKYAHLDNQMSKYDVTGATRMMIGNADGDILTVNEQQILRTTDNGETWNQIDDDETSPGSGHWVGRGGSNLPGENLVVETGMSRYLFCSGEHGLWASAPNGGRIKEGKVAVEQLAGQSKVAHGATSITTAAVHPNDSNTIYIMMFRQTYRGELRRSTDGGKTWASISYPCKSSTPKSPESNKIFQKDLIFDKANPNTMFFCVPYSRWVAYTPTRWERNGPSDFKKFGVYRSKDGGKNWHLANNGLPARSSVSRIEMDPKNSKIMYAALNRINFSGESVANGGLYRTKNGGDRWEKLRIPSEIECVNHVHVDESNGKIYISAGEANGAVNKGGVWVSNNSGSSWKKIFFMPHIKECYTFKSNPDKIIVNVGKSKSIGWRNPGVYYSKDAGSNWIKANHELGQPSRIRALRPDPKNDNIMWAALKGSGWYKGIISNSSVKASAKCIYIHEGEQAQLDGSKSVAKGSRSSLTYSWITPRGIGMSSRNVAKPTITAPNVSKDQTFKLRLRVSDGKNTDECEIRVFVRNGDGNDNGNDNGGDNGNGDNGGEQAEQKAYPSGVPHRIPGTIEAENFDTGGEGIGYHDTNANNEGRAYRVSENVDIQALRSGQHNVGWIENGEWLEYTVDVQTEGKYKLAISYSAKSTTGQLNITSKGATSGTIALPSTGDWLTYKEAEGFITLKAGVQVLRVSAKTKGFNLDKFSVVKTISAKDEIAFKNLPASIKSSKTFAVEVDYNATQERNLVVIFNSPSGAWLGNGTVKVARGKGSKTVNVNLSEAPKADEGYSIVATIRPVGGAFDTNVDVEKETIDVYVPEINHVKNFGFETGDLTSWNSWGDVTVVTNSKSGNYAAKVKGKAAVTNTITGLKPNTEYVVSAYCKVASRSTATFGVKDFGGAASAISVTSASYQQYTIKFKTGRNATSAKIYLYASKTGNVVYGDDFKLVVNDNKKNTELDKLREQGGGIVLYPNPVVNNEVNVGILEVGTMVSIYNVQGRIMFQEEATSEVLKISVKGFRKGIYVLKLQSNNTVTTKKFFIQ